MCIWYRTWVNQKIIVSQERSLLQRAWGMGPSINDVTLFWAKIYPLPPCHISSQKFNPPLKYNVTICNLPSSYSRNYKFPSILCLLRQKFHLFDRLVHVVARLTFYS